jgi:hypothetical protein
MKLFWENGKSEHVDADVITEDSGYGDNKCIEFVPDNFAILKKRTFYDGKKREYDEDEDKEVGLINLNKISYIQINDVEVVKKKRK